MDVMRRPDINGPWRVWRRKTVRLAVSLLLVLSLAVSGGVWWYRWAHPAGPVEPMCLLIMAEDVRPIVGEPTRVLEGYSSYPSVVAGGYWTCSIYGGETRKVIQGVVLKAYSASAAVMVCSNVSRGRQ